MCRIATHKNYMKCIEDIDGDCVPDKDVRNYIADCMMHLLVCHAGY